MKLILLYSSAFFILFLNASLITGSSLKCFACRGGVEYLRKLYKISNTRETILEIGNFICKNYADYNSVICKGIVSQYKESFLYLIEQLLIQPDQLCSLILGGCGTLLNPFNSNWTINLPLKVYLNKKNKKINLKNDKPLTVLQLSDLHYDLEYEPDSEADCNNPICCQRNLNISEKIKQPAGYWGTPGKCDIPLYTIINMLQHINETHKLDYVMLTGDYMSHSIWTYTRKNHKKAIETLSQLFDRYLPNIPIYWGIGNHEAVPVNAFATHFAPKHFQPEWMYKKIWLVEKRWVPKTEKPSAIYRGSYAVPIASNLKLIVINTGYCETTNFLIYLNQTDPDGSLSWLVNELLKCEYNKINAHIMGHIPPGDFECIESWSINYYRIVNRFKDTIKAQFFGHVHTDSFTMFYENLNDANSMPTSVLFSAPSVTTFINLNPAYRLYTIDKNTAEIIDFDTYFLNLTAIRNLPKWEKLYSAKKEYGLNDLSVESWNLLSKQIYANETIYKKFLKNYGRRDDFYCDDDCRTELLCSIRRGHHNSTALC